MRAFLVVNCQSALVWLAHTGAITTYRKQARRAPVFWGRSNAPNEKAAEAAAVAEFDFSDEQRKRLVGAGTGQPRERAGALKAPLTAHRLYPGEPKWERERWQRTTS